MPAKGKADIFSQLTNAEVVRTFLSRLAWAAAPYLAMFMVVLVLLNFFATIVAVSLVMLLARRTHW